LQLLRQEEAARNCKELEQVLLESAPHRDVGLRTPATTLRLAKVLHATGTIQVGTIFLGLSQIVALLEQIEQDSDSARKKLTEQKASISKNQEAVSPNSTPSVEVASLALCCGRPNFPSSTGRTS
jgi:hypothetical protein